MLPESAWHRLEYRQVDLNRYDETQFPHRHDAAQS